LPLCGNLFFAGFHAKELNHSGIKQQSMCHELISEKMTGVL